MTNSWLDHKEKGEEILLMCGVIDYLFEICENEQGALSEEASVGGDRQKTDISEH